ncbi:MAG: crotonase/enoyl-CoA hydratase family protein [Gammaproteobacteria bacterium]|nr:crotonase/enoyl-CoA hydratase family protein [Gammaproteobacteria bacterium]MBT3860444.1 crotonase/enoyl-CoA hydratase family protein [Gammaproteobacteria bacterium]MBT3987893.1 crotonase/enoyl-CoA hydratase family protein [Gammaproteobacteria bacterium]MBT4254960.1 crotonase/enoyl-CoA hydratase family protein [Gammaproteobacteria bacterium]MBT4582420.1 crotonase/enoyl-CoA hydratase family protein [Gammaproteobacteria bacterium]
MQFNSILYEIKEQILTITLNRPEKMNSFTVEMAYELMSAFNLASEDDDIRAIVVTGAGKAFCAGMDLSSDGNVFGLNEDIKPDMEDMRTRLDDPEIESGVRDTGGQVTLAIYDCKKPVIAAINGAAVGIGATMTCAMDIRLVSARARVGFVFNKIGITPEACSSWFLPRIVNMGTALEWIYSAELIEATELERRGFANSVESGDELLEKAYAIARRISQHSPVAIALTRQMMYRNAAQPHPIEAHRVDSLAIFYASQMGGKEGVNAFLEKRPAKYSDKASDMPAFYPWWDA